VKAYYILFKTYIIEFNEKIKEDVVALFILVLMFLWSFYLLVNIFTTFHNTDATFLHNYISGLRNAVTVLIFILKIAIILSRLNSVLCIPYRNYISRILSQQYK
jgi:energy-coupling factor transporter transmembrane protein EcfT